MKKFFNLFSIILITSLNIQIFSFVRYQSNFFPYNISDEKQKIINLLRNNTYSNKLYEAVFSLVDDAILYKNEFIKLAKNISISEEFQNANTVEEKADIILQLLHKNLLKRYTGNDPRLSSVFKSGEYNCVSSTVIYNMLCDYFGIKSSAVVVPEHIFSNLNINGKNIDVETTVRYGFNPGLKRDIRDEFKKITGLVYVPISTGQREYINNFQLISYLYSQIGNYLGAKKKLKESIIEFVNSLLIYSLNRSAIEGLKVSYYELSIEAKKEKKFNISIDIMIELNNLFRNDITTYKALKSHYNNIIVELINQFDFNNAFSIIKNYENKTELKEINNIIIPYVYYEFINYLVKNNNFKNALELAEEKSRKYSILKEVIPVIYNKWIIFYVNKKEYKNALLIAQQSIKLDKKFHNEIINIYISWLNENVNQKKYIEAYAVVKDFINNYSDFKEAKSIFLKFLKHYSFVLVKENKIDEAHKLIDQERHILSDNYYNELKEHIYILSCENYLKSGNYVYAVENLINAKKINRSGLETKAIFEKFPLKLITFAQKQNRLDEIYILLEKLEQVLNFDVVKEAKTIFYYYKAEKEINENQFQKAYEYIKKGLNISKTNYLVESLKIVIINIINLLLEKNKISEAIEKLENALQISDNNYKILDIYKTTCLQIARYYIKENKKNLAIQILHRSLKILKNEIEIINFLRDLEK